MKEGFTMFKDTYAAIPFGKATDDYTQRSTVEGV
jgi:hypothetical protein